MDSKTRPRKPTRFALATFLALALVAVTTQPSSAYELLGHRWASSTVTYNISSGAWASAVSSWNVKVSKVQFVKSSSAKLGLGTANDSAAGWDGLVTPGPIVSGKMSSATARLNSAYTKNYSVAKVKSVAVHELGHVLGLAHRNGCYLMNPKTYERFDVCNINTAQADDVNGVNYLY